MKTALRPSHTRANSNYMLCVLYDIVCFICFSPRHLPLYRSACLIFGHSCGEGDSTSVQPHLPCSTLSLGSVFYFLSGSRVWPGRLSMQTVKIEWLPCLLRSVVYLIVTVTTGMSACAVSRTWVWSRVG